jgi:hypothetical protein
MGRTLQILCGIVVTVALCGALWLAFQPQVPAAANQPASQPDRQYEAGGTACRPESLRSIPDAVARQSKADDCARQREEHRSQQADLEQQTRAANGSEAVAALTKDQTRLALLTTLVSLVATSLLVWTLWETRSTNRAQLRAYVMFEPKKLTHGLNQQGLMAVNMPLKNWGQTPAREVRAKVRIDVAATRPDPVGRLGVSVFALAPGEETAVQDAFDQPLTQDQVAGLDDGTMKWWIVAKVTYRDIFGRERSNCFGGWAEKDMAFSADNTGNDAT